MTEQQSIRLSKRMAELGLCSRGEADDYIAQGLVRVDGVVVDVLGSRVTPAQRIELVAGGNREQPERVSLLLHKPAPLDETQLLAQLVPAQRAADDNSGLVYMRKHQQRLQLFGAVQAGDSGLLVATQDGKTARQMQAGDFEQEWLVNLTQPLSDAALKQLQDGVELDGKRLRAGRVSRQSERQLCVVLKKPAPGMIAAMLAAANVVAAGRHCIRIGRVRLAKLPAGQWRYLSALEKF
ncbi:S4 domain-containing protein [Vogesella oryzae]|uniref:S4 domain-containing protein n=1 Tax=Vogesella oryzae TaxID=1735285 RepID=UPI0015839A9C|nr:S4 domain-containing protein [Vogesella oryzae]